MPPPDSERKLSERDIATLALWISEGAEYEPHWAYIPPDRPANPEVDDPAWPRNPIDTFVLAKQKAQGLRPSPEADRVTLIRRLSFDLRGLPPTPDEVAAFLDDDAPDAYEQLVDRFLASPHFGERLAIDWLDQVRYADTNGFHSDEHRSVWPYRDYVIRAFNENMPFDQFTIEQLAGDLLPDPTRDQLVASGYNRMNQITAEGGAQAKEYLAKYASDRVRTTSTVWMGATMGCAECHDHKFDPYTMKDFYSFAAFFSDIEEVGVYAGGTNWDPILKLPSETQEQELARLDDAIAAIEAAWSADTPEMAEKQVRWERDQWTELARYHNDWSVVTPAAAESQHGTEFVIGEDGAVLTTGPRPDKEVFTLHVPLSQRGITGMRLEVLPHESMPAGLSRGNGNFVLTGFEAALRTGDGVEVPVEFASAEATQQQGNAYPAQAAIDGKSNTGWAADGYHKDGGRAIVFRLERALDNMPDATLVIRLRHESSHAQHVIGHFRVAVTTIEAPGLGPAIARDAALREALRLPATGRNDEQTKLLAKTFRENAPELAPLREERARLRSERETIEESIPFTLVTRAVEPRTTRILPRGNWLDETGEAVDPAAPEFLPSLDTNGERATRLDLARWLVSGDNPLTARVTMNRTWALFFGTGLAKVLDDLGSQGEWPSHPELLDWLAVEFVDSGWDLKHMIRLMVTSSTYRQMSAQHEEHKSIDPFNRYLARQSRMRLEAEMVRDNALAISGLLSDRIGGPSVKPYQPEGYWDNVNTFRGPLIYTASEGDDQYRRGLYTYWKRSFLHPSMLAFDAPAREECTAERVTSNTPLQALVLLNDPTYVEAARVFAEHIVQQGDCIDSRLDWAYTRALSRLPRADERDVLAAVIEKHLEEYRADESAALELLSTGQWPVPENGDTAELAAWTSVARIILNLHETITRS